MTPLPPSFAPQVSAFFDFKIKTNNEDTNAIWARFRNAEPGMAKRFAADSHANISQMIAVVARLNPTF